MSSGYGHQAATRLVTAILLLLLASASTVRAQATVVSTALEDAAPAPDAPADPSLAETWLRAVWGHPSRTGVSYLPWGFHGDSTQLKTFHLTGFVYRNIYGSGFRNSHGDTSWSVGLERSLVGINRFHLGYRVGLMAGYHGSLSHSKGVPFRHTFVFEHNINPIVGLPAEVDLTRHLQFEVFINPLVTLFGLKIVPGL